MTERARAEGKRRGLARQLTRGVLTLVAFLLLVVVGGLLWVGFDTGFPGFREYPPNAELGAFQSSIRLEQEIGSRLDDGIAQDQVLDELPWQEILTHWHTREDVTIEGLKYEDHNVIAGAFHFRAVNDDGPFVYDLATGKLRK